MAGQEETVVDATRDSDDTQGRQRSTIGFPYVDLKSAIALVSAIHGNVGLGECDDSQLAAWTEQSSKSSTFRNQLSGTRMFGLMATDGAGKHKLTDLGRMIVDPARSREAKARAFLNAPLYRAVYDNYKDGVLPPPAALSRDMVGLGVAEKTKDRARQLFERSAEIAGFFAHGKNRLVMPGVAIKDETPAEHKDDSGGQNGEVGGNGGGGGTGGKDPLIAALIQKLPRGGSKWSADDRVTWLQMISMAFQMTYGPVETIEIKKMPEAKLHG
jgi:hypothetical protein